MKLFENRSSDNEEFFRHILLSITFASLAISFVSLDAFAASNKKEVNRENFLARATEKCKIANLPKLNSKLLETIFEKRLKDCQRLNLVPISSVNKEEAVIKLRVTTRRTTQRTTARTTTTTRRTTTTFRPPIGSPSTTRNSTQETTILPPVVFPPPGGNTPGPNSPQPTTSAAKIANLSITASIILLVKIILMI